jgi:hypothetical protein
MPDIIITILEWFGLACVFIIGYLWLNQDDEEYKQQQYLHNIEVKFYQEQAKSHKKTKAEQEAEDIIFEMLKF